MEGYPSEYIHYYLSAYLDDEKQDYAVKLNDLKTKILSQQMAKLNTRKAAATFASNKNKNAKDYIDIYKDLEDPESGLKAILAQGISPESIKPTTSGAKLKNTDISLRSLAQGGSLQKNDPELKLLNNFIETINDILDNLTTDLLGNPKNIRNIRNIILRDLLQKANKGAGSNIYTSIDDPEFLKKIAKELYSKNDDFFILSKQTSGEASIGITLAKTLVKMKILETYAKGGKAPSSSGGIFNNEDIQHFAYSILGGLDRAAGLIFEIAIAKAFQKGFGELSTSWDEMLAAPAAGEGSSIIFSASVFSKLLKEAKKNSNKSDSTIKPDVQIKVTKNGVTMVFGINIKKVTLRNVGQNKIKIQRGTSLMEAIKQGGLENESGFMTYLYNVAASHSKKDALIPVEGSFNENNIGKLNNRWVALTDLISTSMALQAFAGTGKLNDNVLFMVINDNVISIEKILEDLIREGGSSIKMQNAKKGTNITRAIFRGVNKKQTHYKTTQDNALARSALAQAAIIGILQKRKIDLSWMFEMGVLK